MSEGEREGREASLREEQRDRGGGETARYRPTAGIMQTIKETTGRFGSKGKPCRSSIGEGSSDKGNIERCQRLLGGTPVLQGYGFESSKPRGEGRTEVGGVRGEGKSPIKRNSQEFGGRIERKGSPLEIEERLEVGLARVHSEERSLTLLEVKGEKPGR
jgi:hypothetical protein